MNVVFFDDRYFEVYGAQENLLLLAESTINESNVAGTLITTWPGKLEQAALQRNINSIIIEAPPKLRVFEKKRYKAVLLILH